MDITHRIELRITHHGPSSIALIRPPRTWSLNRVGQHQVRALSRRSRLRFGRNNRPRRDRCLSIPLLTLGRCQFQCRAAAMAKSRLVANFFHGRFWNATSATLIGRRLRNYLDYEIRKRRLSKVIERPMDDDDAMHSSLPRLKEPRKCAYLCQTLFNVSFFLVVGKILSNQLPSRSLLLL